VVGLDVAGDGKRGGERVTLESVEPPSKQELRDARTVEITFSILAGAAVSAVLIVVVVLAGWLIGLSGPAWIHARDVILTAAVVLGVGTTVALLVRASRRGL